MKRKKPFHSKKTEYKGIVFDSETEARYYKQLLKDSSISLIDLQPQYQIIKPYEVSCKRCHGYGKNLNPKTSNYLQCRLCNGRGVRTKAGAKYTADFKVTYLDGHTEIIDVKGGIVTRDFPLRKKLLEQQLGVELIVVRYKNKEWVKE